MKTPDRKSARLGKRAKHRPPSDNTLMAALEGLLALELELAAGTEAAASGPEFRQS